MKLGSKRAIMRVRRYLVGASSGLLWLAAAMPAAAQTVYKCPSHGAVLYSQKPCAGRIINTEQAPVPPTRQEEARIAARALRRKPGESAEQFAVRKRRARMLPQDRAECERLDTRMPVEQASMSNPDPKEVSKAEGELERSRKRFGDLHC
jgi:hypothetical protein